MPTILEQYRITDFLEWHKEKKLLLNPNFQRGPVWTPAARTYLIDTILRQLPIPKIYLRTTIDPQTKKSFREVVDGQQRLQAIIDFSNNEFSLSKRAGEFEGLRYKTMNQELQEKFLSYPIAVDQLVNAKDDDVLEVFARLNSYSVQLNHPEKRHARFQGEFKWSVRSASKRWSKLWDTCKILTVRERVRMLDDSLMAEMFGVLLEGVRDGGQAKIDSLYKRYDDKFDPSEGLPNRLDNVLKYFLTNFAEGLTNTPLLKSAHFLMLFAAIAHSIHGIPRGDVDEIDFPNKDSSQLKDIGAAIDNLRELASVIDSEIPSDKFLEFWKASKSSTHRIASRKVRFLTCYRALSPARF